MWCKLFSNLSFLFIAPKLRECLEYFFFVRIITYQNICENGTIYLDDICYAVPGYFNRQIKYPYTFKGLFTCQTRTCVDKMWAEVACKSCGGSCDLSAAIDDANLAEGLLRGLESGAVCCNEDCINKILTAISQLCNWNNCNC